MGRLLLSLFLLVSSCIHSGQSFVDTKAGQTMRIRPMLASHKHGDWKNALVVSSFLAWSITSSSSLAYDPSDFASDTVANAVESLRSSAGNLDATMGAYRNVYDIITEGKGVGGMIQYKGVELDRAVVTDEDTTIYNPGLTLLTDSEKERLVEAVVDCRRAAGEDWNDDSQVAYVFLKEKLDPLHLTELRGYLGVIPAYGALLYVIALGIQQFARPYFTVAYIVGAVAFVLPFLVLLAQGQ